MFAGRRLVLHVGMSKAGSTALQNVLDEHRDALKRRGVLFPSTVFSQNDHADSSRTSGHWELMKRLRSGQPIDDLHDEVEEAAPEVAVLSAEGVFHNASTHDLDTLKAIIGSPAELHVVAAVRDHLSWVLSRYLESVTKGFYRETASVDDFIRRHVEEGSFDYAWRLDVITRHLGADRVTVVDYDRAGPTFVAEMLEAMGLAEWFKDAEVVDQRINGSRPIAAAIEAHRRLNAVAGVIQGADYRAWCADFREVAAASKDLVRGYPEPSVETRKALDRIIPALNADLSARYLEGQLVAGAREFPVLKRLSASEVERMLKAGERGLKHRIRQVEKDPRVAERLTKIVTSACEVMAADVVAEERLRSRVHNLQVRLAAIESSRVWRFAKPFRQLRRRAKMKLKQPIKSRASLMIDVPRQRRQRIDVDVGIFTTLRFPGGNASTTMAEVEAFSKHGLSVRLIHIPVTMSPGISARYTPFLPLVVHCDDVDEITCRLAIVRAPRVILKERFHCLAGRVTADRGVFVVNNSFRRPSGETVFGYDDLADAVASLPWPKKEIYPAGPAIRAEMMANGGQLCDQMPPFDWTPTLDASAIAFAPREQLGRPMAIGRHARDGSEKWPSRHEDLLAAYPDSEFYRVLILGGAAEPSSTFGGQLPSNWTVMPFGQTSPIDYLRQLDVFVYFPHPDLNEAFGRTILEAMFAGVPCVLPRRFNETFGDLALFCDVADVSGVLSRLAADDAGRLRFVRWVRSQVDDHFETTALLRRIPEFGLVDQKVAMPIECPPDIAAFRLRVAPAP